MEVIVDGAQGFPADTAVRDVFDVVAAVSETLRVKGRAILSVHADAQPIGADQLAEAFKGKPLDSVSRIAIVSEDIHRLVLDSLAELEQVLPELPQACHNLAEVFQGDDPESGYEHFHKLAEIWRHIKIRETQVAHALDIDLDALSVDGVSILDLHEGLNEFLNEAVEALEAEDCVTLGDLLEYELAPRAETEARIAALLQEQAARQAR
ncbi:MAG: hypothetical protein QG656_2031 [Candidatus Hydrogenedentes bacterium]|nr:hypothetical protein [Candidatus Hydrogenedentota bacterium]